MDINTNTTIIILSGLVLASYLFDQFSRWSKIPSVLLLMATGVALSQTSAFTGIYLEKIRPYVEFLGTLGLIMIVLEASLDLKLTKERVPLIRNSFLSALLILFISSFLLAGVLYYWMEQPFRICLVYAIPFSIISSAIVIPTVVHLAPDKKEFLVYEASFSDIIGIMLFNFLITDRILKLGSLVTFGGTLILVILISLVASFLLFFTLARIKTHIKFFMIFALLLMLYSVGKIYHLPSLLLILVFGMLINNFSSVPAVVTKHVDLSILPGLLEQMRSITAESAFLIRTFFFILFGYSIDLISLSHPEVVMMGTAIIIVLLAVRFLYLKSFLKGNLFPELFLMPRGLITIILFYSIPEWLLLENFNEGVLFFVIIATALLMMVGLATFKKEKKVEMEII
ncbi:sodium:proton exchanger [bacterium]|nr:sodium:proton exchanger [bacterium]